MHNPETYPRAKREKPFEMMMPEASMSIGNSTMMFIIMSNFLILMVFGNTSDKRKITTLPWTLSSSR